MVRRKGGWLALEKIDVVTDEIPTQVASQLVSPTVRNSGKLFGNDGGEIMQVTMEQGDAAPRDSAESGRKPRCSAAVFLLLKALAIRLASAASVACFALLSGPAAAQYPEKPIRLVVPWPAGGGSDVVARVVAQSLGERLKQTVLVDNRPGANGAIGTELVARALKDGYTLIWVTADTHAINPHVYPKLAYDPRRDFAAVGIAGYFPYALVVNPNFPAANVADFVARARQNPGKITFASWGIGGSAHVAMEMFKQQGGFDVLHVPFQGAAPAMQAVVGGQVDCMIVPISVADPHSRGGRVKMLGLAAPNRFSGAPELKTLAEQGVPVNAGTWVGIMAPAGTPSDILIRLNRALNDTIESPQVRESLLKLNTEPATMTVEQFKSFVDSEYERWGKTVREAKIKAES
jgi:tripartite-type tricarboxylate transporter receptor subunit TctC